VPETIKLLNDHALQDWRDVVERVARPVLMIAGRDSQIWPCEHAEAAIATNPFGRAVIIEDSGHTVGFDQPDRFNDVLLEFLRTQRETLDR
jgi:non-heme chloroperoxidase